MTEESQRIQRNWEDANNLGSQDIMIGDNLELVYKFIFDPKSDYREITKLWTITNLSKTNVERIVELTKVIRILDNKKFYRLTHKKRPTGEYKQFVDAKTGQVIQKAVYEDLEVRESRFEDRLIQKYIGEIQAITAAAGGKDASVIRAFRTAIHQQQIDQKSSLSEDKGWRWKK